MGTVSNILKGKGKEIFSIAPDTSVYQALELMVEKNVSSLLVVEDGKLSGIFTEKDYARKVVLKGKSSKETRIGDIMTEELITVSPTSTIEDCMRLMTGKSIRHLPVLTDGNLVGIISIGDVVKHVIEEQKLIIENMGNYIHGT